MLAGVHGPHANAKCQRMFSQWLQPQSGVAHGNPDETYHIIEGLLTVKYNLNTGNQDTAPWMRAEIDALGTMKVIRVTDVKRGGKDFVTMLKSFLKETAREGRAGPAWSGIVQSSSPHPSSTRSVRWDLFGVIKDFSQDEASKKLIQNVPAWFLRRKLCSAHPAVKSVTQVSILCFAVIHSSHRQVAKQGPGGKSDAHTRRLQSLWCTGGCHSKRLGSQEVRAVV